MARFGKRVSRETPNRKKRTSEISPLTASRGRLKSVMVIPRGSTAWTPRAPARGVSLLSRGDNLERVATFIDGFNLYHAIHDIGAPHLKWLNLWVLSDAFVYRRTQKLEGVYYFSAYATWLPDAYKRHRAYVRALEAASVTVILGKFKEKDRKCLKCGHQWKAHEEKETDVSIAVSMLSPDIIDNYDRGILISQDSDLAPVVRVVEEQLHKPIKVVTPPNRRHSAELTKAASEKAKIKIGHLVRCLFNEVVYDADGNLVVRRPVEYRPANSSS